MSRVRLAVASVLLGTAALVAPTAAYATTETSVQSQDIGWGAATTDQDASTGEQPAPESAAADIGWG